MWRLNTQFLVLREDLCDVTLGVTDLPARSRSDEKPPRTADLLSVQHSDGQPLLGQRPLPHLETVHLCQTSYLDNG